MKKLMILAAAVAIAGFPAVNATASDSYCKSSFKQVSLAKWMKLYRAGGGAVKRPVYVIKDGRMLIPQQMTSLPC